MAEANRVPSVGSVRDSYGSVLAETFTGQYMAEANHYTAIETL